jgi:hypothetical protein
MGAVKLYQGTKRLYARPMSKQEYCDYRGWTVPENEDPHEPGYLVEYIDGGKGNDERHSGYISWSPADVFERTYRETVSSSSDDRTANNGVRHQYRVLTDEEKARMVAVKDAGAALLDALEQHCSPSRETSLARTKAEEAVMWAVKGITG